MYSLCSITTALTLFSLIVPLQAAEDPAKDIPDLTKGGKLERNNERWVGPIGIHCGTWRPRQRSNEAGHVKQLLVQKVEEGSPADGVLEVGDVILGADGIGAKQVPFFEGTPWAMIPIAEAITEAEARNPAILKLLVWRKGETKTLPVKLDYLGRYSDTAPYNCEKSRKILRHGAIAICEKNKPDKSGFGILCLLAASDPTDPNHDKYLAKAREWAHAMEVGDGPWFSGPKLMALSEYYIRTKDETILPKLKAQAEHHAKGVSWFGTTGHRWCESRPDGSENGRIAGYGPISCSGALGYLGLSLAREAGVTSPSIEESHKAQRAFFGHFALKSGIGYGEHPYGIGESGGDYNGKCAMSGLALGLEGGQEEKAKYFAKKAATSSYDVRQYAHGGSFFGQVFHPLGANMGGEKAAHMQFKEIRWHMDLKRRWDYSFIYDSSGNNYSDFSHSAVALLFYAVPSKQIYLTGRGHKNSIKLSDAEFDELAAAQNFDPSKASNEELFAALPSCQGLLRGPVGNELASRVKEKPDAPEANTIIDELLAMVTAPKSGIYERVGACFALMQIKDRSPEAARVMKNAEIAKAMVGLLQDPDAYIRFAGVRVLQKLDPEAVSPHVNEILDAVVATGRPTFPLDMEDPLQWAHGEMGDLLFKNALTKSLDGVDRAKLIPAIRSLLETPNGGARGAVTSVLAKLSKEETLQVADLIVQNIRIDPPGNAMGGGAAALNSQKALANHLFEEVMPLSTSYGPTDAIKSKIPQKYGKAALEMRSARQVMNTVGEQILVQAINAQELVEGILNGKAPEELATLKRIDSVKAADPILKLPVAQTLLVADATNFAVRGENQTLYTWRKIYGPGKVSFEPNSTGDSKTSTVSFIDKKPGKYCFEVEMSDSLGITVVRETLIVSLHNSAGKMPGNRAPQVKSQSLAAVPGQRSSVTLVGTDPDGDDLGFVVTQLPAHGVLTDADGRLIETLAAIDRPLFYTADYGHNGKDQLTFLALDGQGVTAKGTVDITISSENVGVLVYEGFEYPAGGVHGQEGGSSFGFSSPWQTLKEDTGKYKVDRGKLDSPDRNPSLSYAGMPSTGGRLKGGRHRSTSRALDPVLLAKHGVLEPGGEFWFSVYVDGAHVKFALQGPDTALGFLINPKQSSIYPMLNGKEAGEARNPWSRSSNLRLPEKEPQMIVGRCVWGKTDKDLDTLEIYRVYNAPVFGPMLIDEPVGVLQEVIPQRTLNAIQVEMFDDHRTIDEIRIGTTLPSVMIGTKPMK
ncbi:MAG: DUF6288 domain-containing protein [Akkermansiaceae bacterium]